MPGSPASTVEDRRLVLLVDDDPDLLDALQASLARLSPGFTFLAARSAEDGLAVLSQADVSLVVSDFRLPGQDGVEFLERVGRDFPGVRRVLLTGDPERDLASSGANAQAFDRMFIKPVDALRLSQVCTQLVRRGGAANAQPARMGSLTK